MCVLSTTVAVFFILNIGDLSFREDAVSTSYKEGRVEISTLLCPSLDKLHISLLLMKKGAKRCLRVNEGGDGENVGWRGRSGEEKGKKNGRTLVVNSRMFLWEPEN